MAGGEDIGPYAPYRQSQRLELYAREADRLLEAGDGLPLLVHAGGARGRSARAGGDKEPPRYNRPLPAT